ncbi:MAG: hypothetical protein KJP00_02175 [Bacteroidia bacterium]|nr:hypothetical protein [Bacteroidia bacterium]
MTVTGKKIKVFSVLDDLDTYELNRFDKFVKSPYFNVNQSIIQLFNQYIHYRKTNGKSNLSKEDLWKKAFPDQPYNDGRLRKALSDLLKLLEDFFCQELMQRQPIYRATMLLESIEERNLGPLVNSVIKRARQLTSKDHEASARMHYHRYEVEKSFYELTDYDIKRIEKSNLPRIISNLDYFYLAEKLKYYCTSISRSAFVEHDFNFLFIKEIEQHIENNQYEEIPIVNIWINIFFLQKKTGKDVKKYFQQFKTTFKSIIADIPQKEAAQIFTYGQNFCIKQINSGQSEYFQELFELNREAVSQNILVDQSRDNLDPWVFRNMVTVALRLKEYAWTAAFIDSYGSYIQEDFRRNAVSYSLALFSFYQNKYSEVLDHLNDMDIMDISYELNSKSLLIMTYYEMDEIDPLNSLLDSFYVYLNRHKDISKARRENYQNMISFTRRLMNINPTDKKAHEKLMTKFQQTKGIASAAWLKEKIEERML